MNKKLQFTLLLSLVVLLTSFTSKTKESKTEETTTITASFGPVKAAFIGPTRKAFFFTGKKYYKQNLTANRLEKSAAINEEFKGLVNNIDAALLHTNGKAYFFKGSKYYRYNYYSKKIEKEGTIGVSGWKGVPNNVDAVLHANGYTYFFKGYYYYRYNSKIKKVDRKDRISKYWKGVPNYVDAAFSSVTGNEIFFFKGDTSYRYIPNKKRVDRQETMGKSYWKGLFFTEKLIVKKLKITLTSMKVLKSDRKYETLDVFIRQIIRYKANEKTISSGQGGRLNTNARETVNEYIKLQKQGLNIFIKAENISLRTKPNYTTYSQISNSIVYPLNTKEVADINAFMEIRTTLSGYYLKNGRILASHLKIVENLPIKVKINEILKYLLNPNDIPLNYFNNDGYHYSGTVGSVMPFKIAKDRNALEGYVENSNNGITIRTYFHFELVK